MKKYFLYILLASLFLIQLIRPERNNSGNDTAHIDQKFHIPENVKSTLQGACYDCHSNRTTYPAYAEIQPLGWWLNHHVNEGKEHLNFSAFTNYSDKKQEHAFEEIIEVVTEKEMPLASYTWFSLHPEAKLTDEQRQNIISWANEQMVALSGSLESSEEVPGEGGEEASAD